jgi:peptidoglycan DL-endopeptidase RipA
MSNGDEPFGSDGSRPAFATVVRGYDKRQVDHHISRLENDQARLAAEHQRAFRQIQDMGAHLREVTGELHELRTQPRQLDRASFRDVGPMVDQILALAEKQADLITTAAAEKGAELAAEAEKALAEAREAADKLRTDAQSDRENTRQQTQKEMSERRDSVEKELAAQRQAANEKNVALHAEAQQYTTDLRRKADEAAAERQQQLMVMQKEIEARREALTQLEAELTAAHQQLGQVRQEATSAKNELAQVQHQYAEVSHNLNGELERLEQARRAAESAERHAKDVRARVQREAERVASLAAAAVMAAAQRGAETGEYPQVAANVSGLLASEGLTPPPSPVSPVSPVSPAPSPSAVESSAPVSPAPVSPAPVSPAPVSLAPVSPAAARPVSPAPAPVAPPAVLPPPAALPSVHHGLDDVPRPRQTVAEMPLRRPARPERIFEAPSDDGLTEELPPVRRRALSDLPRREPDQIRREIEQEAVEAAIPLQRVPDAERGAGADGELIPEDERIPADAD